MKIKIVLLLISNILFAQHVIKLLVHEKNYINYVKGANIAGFVKVA